MNNLFLSFLVELFNRFATKKPKLFVYLQWVMLGLGAVTGLPAFLQKLGITLSPALTVFENKFVAAAAAGFVLCTQLVTKSPTVGVTADGTPIAPTDAAKLPFTAKVEIKEAQVKEIPNSPITMAEIQTVSKINS